MLKRLLMIHLFVGVLVISVGLVNNAAAQDIDLEADYQPEPAVAGKTAVVAGLDCQHGEGQPDSKPDLDVGADHPVHRGERQCGEQ
jgi:hypothetical protein